MVNDRIERMIANWWIKQILNTANYNFDKKIILNAMNNLIPSCLEEKTNFRQELMAEIKMALNESKDGYIYLVTKDGVPLGILNKLAKKYGLMFEVFPRNITMVITPKSVFYSKDNSDKVTYIYDESLNIKHNLFRDIVTGI